MNKKEMVNKLNKIIDEVEKIQLELGVILIKDENNKELNFTDNALDNAFNNLINAEYYLKKSL